MENKWMRRAIALAVENVKKGGGPFAALVVKDGAEISSGVNRVTRRNDPTAHAEIAAIRAACLELKSFQLSDCEIYSTCEPCPMCLGAIYWARLARLFCGCTRQDAARFGFDDSFIYQQIALEPSRRSIPSRAFLRDEALAAFAAWERKADKVRY